jgi:hypothetical protein
VPPYYQPVLDALATNPDPWLEMVRDLCVAVEAENGPKIVLLTGPLVRTVEPRRPPIEDLPPEVFYETMARMLFMGEHRDFELLLEWYEPLISFARGRKERLVESWAGIFQFVTLPAPNLPEKDLDKQLKRITTALSCVLAAHETAVKAEGKPPPYMPAPGQEPPGGFSTPTYHRPPLSAALADGIRKLVASWMAVHQQFLDAASQQLGSKKPDRGDKLLALRERLRRALALTFEHSRYAKSTSLPQVQIDLATIKYGRSPHHLYLDAFLPHEARQFGFTPYDREPQDEPRGKSVWLEDLFRYRWSQLYLLLDEYGVYYPLNPAPSSPAETAEEKKRKAKYAERSKLVDEIQKRAPLRLESADDLVAFGCAYFDALLRAKGAQPTPDDRLDTWASLLQFLQRHLDTQTTHTEFNLDEAPPYFDRLFPRAINGGALEDCGVYAVLLSFVFLSLASCIKAPSAEAKPRRVSFLMLPLHVGLIVEIDPYLPIFVHNNVLFRPTDEQLNEARTEWSASPEKSDPKDPKLREDKFREDVAAQVFLRDVDLPLLRLPLAPVSAPPTKAQIWKAYQRLVVKKIERLLSPLIEDPRRPEFQFDTRFLQALTLEKRWHDANVVPLWNDKLYGLWKQSEKGLADPGRRGAYAKTLEDLLTPVDDRYKEVLRQKDELTTELRANPDLLGRGSQAQRITRSSRLKGFGRFLGPLGEVREHLDSVKAATGTVREPRFADKANQLSRFGE